MKIYARRIGAIAACLNWPFHGRQKRVNVNRKQYEKDYFTSSFSDLEKGQEIASSVWDILVSISTVSDFRPFPDDDLVRIYGLAEEDLDEDVVLPLLREHGGGVPNVVDDKSLLTIRDLVEYLSLRVSSGLRQNKQN